MYGHNTEELVKNTGKAMICIDHMYSTSICSGEIHNFDGKTRVLRAIKTGNLLENRYNAEVGLSEL
jgi:hypothetical protein